MASNDSWLQGLSLASQLGKGLLSGYQMGSDIMDRKAKRDLDAQDLALRERMAQQAEKNQQEQRNLQGLNIAADAKGRGVNIDSFNKEDGTFKLSQDPGYLSPEARQNNRLLRQEQIYEARELKKEQQYQNSSRIKDYEIVEGFRPDLNSTKAVREADIAQKEFEQVSNEIIGLIDKGARSPNITSAEKRGLKDQLSEAYSRYIIASKEAGRLGALTGPDLQLVSAGAARDPSSIYDMALRNDETAKNHFRDMIQRSRKGVSDRAESYGYRLVSPERLPKAYSYESVLQEMEGGAKKGLKNPQSQMQSGGFLSRDVSQQSKPGLVVAPPNSAANKTKAEKIRVSNGKETYLIEPNDLAEAMKDGFKVIQ